MTETACFEQKNGRLGWNWAKTSNFVGSTPCGKCTAKKCVSGWLISEMSQHCTPLDWYWVFTPVPGGEYSGAEECGTCVLNCSNDIFGSTPTQSYIDPVPDILGNIAGDYIPWVRHNRLCPREGVGTDPVSGGKGCYYSCNLQSAYNSWMGYASSATNVMELVRNCISNCRIVAQELTSWYSSSSTEVQRKKDESICYTMCLMAAQKKYRELTKNGGGNSDYWTFYCPSDMKMCCNGNVASKNGYDYTLPDGTTLTPFKCGSDSQPLRTSCRRNNCSSWD